LPKEVTGQAVVFENEQPRLRLPLPSLPEWRLEDGQATLSQLAEASGGRLLTGTEELRRLPDRKALSLQLPLVALALLLFMLERYLEYRRRMLGAGPEPA
jgi:hypothetical protein